MAAIGRAAPAALAFALAACTAGQHTTGGDVVGKDYQIKRASFSNGAGVWVATALKEDRGMTVVCSAVGYERFGANDDEMTEAFFNRTRIRSDGWELVSSMDFAPLHENAPPPDGASAGCVRTGVPWMSDFAGQPPLVYKTPRVVGHG